LFVDYQEIARGSTRFRAWSAIFLTPLIPLLNLSIQVREVCADFEELRGFQIVCWREDVPDEDSALVKEAVGVGGTSGGTELLHAPTLFVTQRLLYNH